MSSELSRPIIYFGKSVTLRCDGICEKSWGVDSRPKIEFDENNWDDFVFLSDSELGTAPANPGTYEGGCAKPTAYSNKGDWRNHRLNKWCSRQCERSWIDGPYPDAPNDFSKRVYNCPALHPEA